MSGRTITARATPKGQGLVIEASASTAFAGYVYVDFVQHDGSVLHMMWTEQQVGRNAAAGQQFLLGTAGQTFTIVPPFGTEMLVVVSSPTPLFNAPRPQVEDAKTYLAELETALKKATVPNAENQPVSNYHFITTGPAK